MIRAVREAEIGRCAEVIRDSFMTVAREFGITAENAPRFTAFSVSAERLQWQMNAERRPMFVYVEKSEIIGYYSLALLKNDECELNNLCVTPRFRHGGAGGELLLHSFETARQLGFGKLNIGIVEENTQLRKWYEKFGFEHIGTQKFDFFPFTCGYMTKIL